MLREIFQLNIEIILCSQKKYFQLFEKMEILLRLEQFCKTNQGLNFRFYLDKKWQEIENM